MMTLLLQMLLSFMKIGALSFGGAYASIKKSSSPAVG